MNTLDKVVNLQSKVRELEYNLENLTKQLLLETGRHHKTKNRVDNLEKMLLNKFSEIFEGEDSPIGELEQRIKTLEKEE